ncbi:Methyltransferase-like protein 13 [Nymphaea thermarum]|nr:Methyltransferase-like protein 13 [Nymphaea thermarum]
MTFGGTQAYGEPSYWDKRYSQDPGPFDWYQKYATLAPLFNLYIQRSHRILIVGCGNAAIGEGMLDDNYEDIVNIDISSVVIDAMQKKYSNRPQLKYIWMDVRDMHSFESDSFDVVIDKELASSGTLDSLMCGQNSQSNAGKMLDEIWRVLKDRGVYILITYGAPLYRLSLLREPCFWSINLHVIEKFGSEKEPQRQTWEVTDAIPLKEDGSFDTSVLGDKPDVHYVYVCIKDKSLRELKLTKEIKDEMVDND